MKEIQQNTYIYIGFGLGFTLILQSEIHQNNIIFILTTLASKVANWPRKLIGILLLLWGPSQDHINVID
jgi:hypothetical protein